MPTTAVIDIKEHFCSIALFAEGWKGSELLGAALVQGTFLDDTGETARKVKEEIGRLSPYDVSSVLLLPRSLVHMMSVEIPAKNEEILKKMMEFEVTRRFPIPQDQLLYDYFVVGRSQDRFAIDLAGFRRDDFEAYFNRAKEAGMYPDIVSLSSATWVAPETEDGEPSKRTFIEVLPEGFEMSVVDNHTVAYSRFIRFKPRIGGEPFFRGSFASEEVIGRITGAISDELNHVRLVSGIEQMELYLARVYIAGGGVLHSGIKHGLKLKPGFAESDITTFHDEDDETGFGHVAKAVGEAGLETKFRFNFIPKKMRRISNVAAKRWLKITVGVIAALLVVWMGADYSLHRKALATLKSDLAALKTNTAKLEEVDLKIDTFNTYLETYRKFLDTPSFTLPILSELTEIVPHNTFLLDIDIRKREVSIAGISDDASPLLETLENSPHFKNVRMIDTIKRVGEKEKFKIGMEYE